jgi:hypothetical protein
MNLDQLRDTAHLSGIPPLERVIEGVGVMRTTAHIEDAYAVEQQLYYALWWMDAMRRQLVSGQST